MQFQLVVQILLTERSSILLKQTSKFAECTLSVLVSGVGGISRTSGLVKCSYTRLDECSLVGIFIREINLINRYKLEGGRRLINNWSGTVCESKVMEQVKQMLPLEVKQEVLLPLRQDNHGGSDHGSS